MMMTDDDDDDNDWSYWDLKNFNIFFKANISKGFFYPKNALFEDINFAISRGRGEGGVVMKHEGTLGLN
jgi:hypothetical protein